MSLSKLINSFPWTRYSKKLATKIEKTRAAGFFTKKESEARDMRLVESTEGSVEDGNMVRFFWLVDRDDGIIVDAKYQVFGQSALIGAAEIAAELLIGKNYDQARRITAVLIDQQARDKANAEAFPPETIPHLNLVLAAIQQAADQCMDLPLPQSYTTTPKAIDIGEVNPDGYPGWLEMSIDQKVGVIEQVLNQDIRPYIALDAGGVEIIKLVGLELHIKYQGSCTTCYSSIGTTLSYIQQVLRAKVNPALVVTPDMSALKG